ncbi:MAG: hypothetical protein AB8D52_06390 [Gammaproteobacteria bacterium]
MQKQNIIKTDHGSDYEFLMALHINDLVSVEKDSKQIFYRIQILENPGKLELRLHTASTLKNDAEKIRKSISTLMSDHKLRKHQNNVIGKLLE